MTYSLTPEQEKVLAQYIEEYGDVYTIKNAVYFRTYAWNIKGRREGARILIIFRSNDAGEMWRELWQIPSRREPILANSYIAHRTDGPAVIVYESPHLISERMWIIEDEELSFAEFVTRTESVEDKKRLLLQI